MKKKLLFAVLTTLMVLPGCGAKAQKSDLKIIEDTDAHEEIFGEVEQLQLDNVRNVPVFMDNAEPAIGVQSQDAAGGKIHVRFVAAIKIDGDLASATAVWTRKMFYDGAAGENSHKVFKEAANKESKKIYSSLKNGDDILTIASYNSSHSSSYTGFVVYTMLNIPKSTYKDYFLNAYVTVNDEDTKISRVLATTVDQKTQLSFDYGKNETGYFGVKKVVSEGVATFTTFDKATDSLGNYARFTNVSLNKDESFVLVNSASDYFAVHGYNKTHAADSSDSNFNQDGTSLFAKAKATASHYLYLSSGGGTQNYIYRADANTTKGYFVKPCSGWYSSYPRFALYTAENVNEKNVEKWYNLIDCGSGVYGIDIDFTNLSNVTLIFCRMNPGTVDNNWTNRWTQTVDLKDDDAHTKNLFTLDNGDYNTNTGSWSNRT